MTAPAPSFLDNQHRSGLAVAGLAIATAVAAGNLCLMALFLGGVRLPMGENARLLLSGLWDLLAIGALAFCAITFMLWFRRAYHNAAALGLRRRLRTGWAIGSWFVPIANLLIPFLIARAMWNQAGKQRVGGTGVVGSWWLTWIAGTALITGGLWLAVTVFLGEPGEIASLLRAAGYWLEFMAGTLAIRIVRKLTRAQDDMHLLARSDAAFGEAPPLPGDGSRGVERGR